MSKKKNLLLRSISIVLISAFFVQEIAYSAPLESVSLVSKPLELISQNPTLFEAPLDFVSMKEVHEGDNGIFIIHIQDAHSNLSGQQNLASAINEIMSKYGVSLVLSEGGVDDCSLNNLKQIAPPQVWKKVAKSYLIQGKISGEEYLNLTSDHPMKIMGIEDLSLYLTSVDNYGKLADKREEILNYLKTIQSSIDKLKNKYYPDDLLNYEKSKAENKSSNFEVNFKGLFSLAKNHQISLSDFPDLEKLSLLVQRENDINFESANLELSALIEQIYQKGGKEDLETHLRKINQMKDSKAAQFAYFQNTLNITKDKNIDTSNYQNLLLYLDYLKSFSEIDLDQVLNELTKAEDEVYVQVLQSEDSKLTRSIDRYLGLLFTAYKIQMTTTEFKFFEINEPDFSTVSYLAFINRKLAENGYFDDLIPFKNVLEEGKKALVDFYESVNQRDTAFLENTEKILAQEKQKVAVLISGGYHTPHLKELFRQKGYSYAVLTPMVTSETNQAKYEKRLLSPIRKETKILETVSNASKIDDNSLSDLEKEFKEFKKNSGVKTALIGMIENGVVKDIDPKNEAR